LYLFLLLCSALPTTNLLTQVVAINGSGPHERFTKRPIREALLFYPSYRELCDPPSGPVGRSCDFPSLATYRAASKNRLSSALGRPTVASERREVPAKKLPGLTPSSLQPPPPNLYELKFRIILLSLRMIKITRKAFCVNCVIYPRGIAVVKKTCL